MSLLQKYSGHDADWEVRALIFSPEKHFQLSIVESIKASCGYFPFLHAPEVKVPQPAVSVGKPADDTFQLFGHG